MNSNSMTEPKRKFVAPDGGWGWVIVAGFAISNVISIPVLQGFTLLFRNVFQELNLSTTDISTIVNVNSAFGLFLGLINGPLLKMFGFRKYAMVGSSIMFVGLLLTSQASSFTEFIIYYGIINSVGFIMTMSAFSLAINTYFSKKRSKAAGVSTTLTGLGPVVMPLLISYFLDIYGARGTALILSGLILHSFVAALLLQPVKWHDKHLLDEELGDGKEMAQLNPSADNEEKDEIKDLDTFDSHSIHGLENVLVPRRLSDAGRRYISHSRLSVYENDKVIEPDSKWWSKESNDPNQEDMSTKLRRLQSQESKLSRISIPGLNRNQLWYQKLIKFFDLDLLKDPVYRNIWFGMSLAFTGEINFSLMTPMIMGDRNFEIEQTAKLMSTIASSDIIFRFISPFIGDKAKIPPRQMYMISLIMLIVCRTALTFVYSFYHTLIVCLALGIAKGFRTVYMTLVIPNHVPLEKLPSASGLQTVLNGVLLFGFGPIAGYVRDASGNFNIVIHLINLLSLSTVILWSIEMLIVFRRNKIKNKNNNIKSEENNIEENNGPVHNS